MMKVLFEPKKPTDRDVRQTWELQMCLLNVELKGILEDKFKGDVIDALLKDREGTIRTLGELWLEAYEKVDQRGIYTQYGNRGLQYELQCDITNDVIETMETFQRIDDRLPERQEESYDIEEIHIDILLRELMETKQELAVIQEANRDLPQPRQVSQTAFLQKKQGAIETLLDHHAHNPDPSDLPLMDDFGFHGQGSSKEVLKAMRYHQTVNLCRASLLKQELGYATIALASTIPEAGRGIFLDGRVLTGTVIAFFPGDIWAREFLVDMTDELAEYFATNPKHQLRLRSDELLVDCRASPYTVLQNPWAIAHIANHPTPDTFPNALAIPIDYYEEWKLKRSGLEKYIPNQYAREPPILGTRLLNRHVIDEQGMLLLSSRQVFNEEITYDYMLLHKEPPDWYHKVDVHKWEYGDSDDAPSDNTDTK